MSPCRPHKTTTAVRRTSQRASRPPRPPRTASSTHAIASSPTPLDDPVPMLPPSQRAEKASQAHLEPKEAASSRAGCMRGARASLPPPFPSSVGLAGPGRESVTASVQLKGVERAQEGEGEAGARVVSTDKGQRSEGSLARYRIRGGSALRTEVVEWRLAHLQVVSCPGMPC
ncbi:hypothetical protein BJY59DRAFT_454735 [Rhodotorula toruloides]